MRMVGAITHASVRAEGWDDPLIFAIGWVSEVIEIAGERAPMRFLEFFAANIRNPHTRRAYAGGAEEFLSGPRALAYRRSPTCTRSMRQRGSKPERGNSPRQASSNGLPHWLSRL
jgi:hypothetical protein